MTTHESRPQPRAHEKSQDLVALLRGVNVGGVTIRSAELRALFGELGFDDARTFLATGNVRFSTPSSPGLKARIEHGLSDRFGYTAWIILITAEALQTALDGYPFDAADSSRTPYIVFTADPESLSRLTTVVDAADPTTDPAAVALSSTGPSPTEESESGPGIIYWAPPKGESTSTPFAKELARSTWKSVTTTRNVRTVAKILD